LDLSINDAIFSINVLPRCLQRGSSLQRNFKIVAFVKYLLFFYLLALIFRIVQVSSYVSDEHWRYVSMSDY